MYNRTVTNIENTVRAVHSCNSWFCVAVLEMLHSTHGKNNYNIETEKSEQTLSVSIFTFLNCICHTALQRPYQKIGPCRTSVLRYIFMIGAVNVDVAFIWGTRTLFSWLYNCTLSILRNIPTSLLWI